MSKTRIILQARLNSSRLPGKMLLPISGIPLIVLCAKRAELSGHEVVVVTSKQSSDDPLVKVLHDNSIVYRRGDLNDVLSRFIEASKDMNHDDLVVRLTGDNPFVDALFINNILTFHAAHDQNYTRTLSPQDGFPYGLSAEVITVGALRDIAINNPSAEQKEHVTIALTQSGNYELYTHSGADLSHLTVTVDTFDEYLIANKTFEQCGGASEKVTWQALLKTLQSFPDTPKCRAPFKLNGYKAHSFLSLGTAQLGLNYGLANKTGQPNLYNSNKIIQEALSYGIESFDTAAAYGESEAVLGKLLPVDVKATLSLTTKLDPLPRLDAEDVSDSEIVALVENSVYRSLYRIGLKCLPVLLLHRWQHYSSHNGLIWKTLLRMKKEGLIRQLGASVQGPVEGLEALAASDISFIQIPYNILDTRWEKSGFIESCMNKKDTHIQTRSTLLQGVLTLPPQEWPLDFKTAEKTVDILQGFVDQMKRDSIVDLCYAYVRSQTWVDSIVVGVEKIDQLTENIELFNTPLIKDTEGIGKKFWYIPQKFLNPACWSSTGKK